MNSTHNIRSVKFLDSQVVMVLMQNEKYGREALFVTRLNFPHHVQYPVSLCLFTEST
jgi:hypothetical protein